MAKKSTGIKIPTSSALDKKYKGSGIASQVLNRGGLRLPSRFLYLNYTIGGGLPYGKILEIFGEESSGKSLLAFDFAYCAQQLGGIVIWIDAEQAFTIEWAEANGLDLDKVDLYSETAIENISDFIKDKAIYWRSILTNNEPILFVTDSIASLNCLSNVNADQMDAKAEMGNRAKKIDEMLRTRNGLLSDLGICSIFINQVRAKIGATKYEDPYTTPGGKAVAFYASIRLGIYGGKQIKGKIEGYEDRVGRCSTIRVIKNKVGPPRPTIKAAEVYFNPLYKEPVGYKKYFGLAELLVRLKAVERKKGASRYYYKEKMIANGEEAFLKVLLSDDKLRSRLIRKSGINTISTTQKEIDEIQSNLYPVKAKKETSDEQ